MADRDYETEKLDIELNLPYMYNNKKETFTKEYNFKIRIITEDWDDYNGVYRDPVWIDKLIINWEEEITDETSNEKILFYEYIIKDIHDIIEEKFLWTEYDLIDKELNKVLTPELLEELIDVYIKFETDYTKICCVDREYIEWYGNFTRNYNDYWIKTAINKMNNNNYIKIKINNNDNIILEINGNNNKIEIEFNDDFFEEYNKLIEKLKRDMDGHSWWANWGEGGC